MKGRFLRLGEKGLAGVCRGDHGILVEQARAWNFNGVGRNPQSVSLKAIKNTRS